MWRVVWVVSESVRGFRFAARCLYEFIIDVLVCLSFIDSYYVLVFFFFRFHEKKY